MRLECLHQVPRRRQVAISDSARGDGHRIGPGQKEDWRPEIISDQLAGCISTVACGGWTRMIHWEASSSCWSEIQPEWIHSSIRMAGRSIICHSGWFGPGVCFEEIETLTMNCQMIDVEALKSN